MQIKLAETTACSISFQTLYAPLALIIFITLFLCCSWLLIKDIFLTLYMGTSAFRGASNEDRYGYTNNGSDYSRDNLIEMHSYLHSSPRVSYVTSMADRVAI